MATTTRRRFLSSVLGGALAVACGGSTETSAPSTSTPQTELLPPTIAPSATVQPETLRSVADVAGVEVAATVGYLNVSGMSQLLQREFNGASVVDIGWQALEESRGNVIYTNARQFKDAEGKVNFALSAQARVSAQAIIFAAQYPDWLRTGISSPAEAAEVLRNHVTEVVSHFKGRVSVLTVVNEFHPIAWGRDDILQRLLGNSVLDISYEAARLADPNAILLYNDNANHARNGQVLDRGAYPTTKAIVDRLKVRGLVDGVGLQMHLDGAAPPAKQDVIGTMQSYGMPVFVTEMDVNLKDLDGTEAERFGRQAEIYRDMFQAGLESGSCRSFTFFTVGDRWSWIETDKTYPNHSLQADPTLFDDNLRPKPAYFAVRDVLKEFGNR